MGKLINSHSLTAYSRLV